MYQQSRIGWTGHYQLGIQTIDQQHRNLLKLINELADVSHLEQPVQVTGALLAQLFSNMAKHFDHEEELLELRRFPQAQVHKAEHTRYLSRLEELNQRFARTPSSETLLLIHRLLAQWFVEHIEQEDRLFAPYLKALEG